MNKNRNVLGAAAFSLALAGGGVAGAMLGTPSLSTAQISSSAQTTTDPSTSDAPPPGTELVRFGRDRAGLAAAAEALGMTEADLRTELLSGKSIADVAAEKNVDVQTVIDALVTAAKSHLAEIEAALPDQMTKLVNRTGWGEHRPQPILKEGLDKAAAVIGISSDELKTELQSGKTVADVAGEHNVDVQKVIDALVADATAKIDQAVADGKLDSTRADDMKAHLVERVTAMVNGEGPGPGGRRGFRGPGGLGAPDGSNGAGTGSSSTS